MWEPIGLCRKAASFSRNSPEDAARGVRTIGKTPGAGIMDKDKYRQVATLGGDQRKSSGSLWKTSDSQSP